jgi:hypothetical protein
MSTRGIDARLRLASEMMVCGPSQCGKTVFVNKLISDIYIFNPKPKHVEWYYGQIKPTTLNDVSYIQGLPDIDKIHDQSLIILDDLMLESAKDSSITNLFTRVSHHKECFIIFITQNMYHQSAHNRTRNLNVHYLVLFKNVRDMTIINTLSRQMYPMSSKFLPSVYDFLMKKPYSYIFLDLRSETDDKLRVRSNIFTSMDVFINNTSQI